MEEVYSVRVCVVTCLVGTKSCNISRTIRGLLFRLFFAHSIVNVTNVTNVTSYAMRAYMVGKSHNERLLSVERVPPWRLVHHLSALIPHRS